MRIIKIEKLDVGGIIEVSDDGQLVEKHVYTGKNSFYPTINSLLFEESQIPRPGGSVKKEEKVKKRKL